MNLTRRIIERARKKALQSDCTQRVSALGFNRKDECVTSSINYHRFTRSGGGIHAEMAVMRQSRRKGIVTILICRVSSSGEFLPISPCAVCAQKAKELNIRILTISA